MNEPHLIESQVQYESELARNSQIVVEVAIIAQASRKCQTLQIRIILKTFTLFLKLGVRVVACRY